MTDPAVLISRVKSGDNIAAGQLIDLYQDKVYKICYSFLNNTHDAEDLTQDVFIDILQNLKNFRGDSAPGTWIYRIAVNRSLNFIRSRKKYKWWKQIDDLLTFTVTEKEPSVSDTKIEDEEGKTVLMKAIDALPVNQRTAFTLNKLDELSYNEIADIMGMTLSAIESLIHRAKINLQKSLKAYFRN